MNKVHSCSTPHPQSIKNESHLENKISFSLVEGQAELIKILQEILI